MEALDLENLETKEFKKLADIAGMVVAREFLQKGTPELEAAYSDYFVEKKRKFDALMDLAQYAEDVQDIKYIKKAEKERIAPEKCLFELAIVCVEASKNGDDLNTIYDSKPFGKCEKMSGHDYALEFSEKTTDELKEYCYRFFLLQNQVKKELEENEAYQAALGRKKALEADVTYDLREMESKAKMALVVLKSRKEILMEASEES